MLSLGKTSFLFNSPSFYKKFCQITKVKPKIKIGFCELTSRYSSIARKSISPAIFKAYIGLIPNIENPAIPAALALNLFLESRTLGKSIIIMGSLECPRISFIMIFNVLVCLLAVKLSRVITDGLCPEVPLEVSTLKISFFVSECKLSYLNKRTGKKGTSSIDFDALG